MCCQYHKIYYVNYDLLLRKSFIYPHFIKHNFKYHLYLIKFHHKNHFQKFYKYLFFHRIIKYYFLIKKIFIMVLL
jgi:hypothetical protein